MNITVLLLFDRCIEAETIPPFFRSAINYFFQKQKKAQFTLETVLSPIMWQCFSHYIMFIILNGHDVVTFSLNVCHLCYTYLNRSFSGVSSDYIHSFEHIRAINFGGFKYFFVGKFGRRSYS